MIKWVDERLERWGEWMNGLRRSGGAGGSYPAYQPVHIRGTAGPDLCADADEMEIDTVMAGVKASKKELYETGYQRYVQGMSNQTIAGRMRCHVNTVYARMESLHKLVEKRMAERKSAIADTNA
ncbi:antiterminator Q family protein [Noviherbaspirillum autotrophicum]|uniref:Uncharacterized protein n=1 Tax=Noviherbaspirillum autotrophicum TaxID=709839 RepID=A0A0C2BHT5_9BURK|nr:antiterminator Q family protein [Noviherbaspirillum autotrophicum]KIF80785.1 hypothetical protein TSA66_08060 [Noviherbaspirillum autotrophicum]KIF80822.1 hypothetical protein TSA66_08305 [Noviherbaspirillum autotrophicum]KIF84047.1 hypothetical protein TSA66_00995 [Noviherbaspirillum autotrophicum]